jgi:hypothetical protein
MRIQRKDLNRLIKLLVLEGRGSDNRPVWSYSPDSDFPAAALKHGKNFPFGKTQKGKAISVPLYTALHSKRALLLRDDDDYKLTPDINTHGGESHALKHLAELDPKLVYDTMNDLIDLVIMAANANEITVPINTIDIHGNIGVVNVIDITPGDMLNTVDQIYDDQVIAGFSDIDDNSLERKIITSIQAMLKNYDSRVDRMTDTSANPSIVDVSNKNLALMDIVTPDQLLDWFAIEPRVISFKASFAGGPRGTMYLDSSTTEYVGSKDTTAGGLINTLMAKKKKPPTTWSQVFGDMGNVIGKDINNTQIDSNTHSLFRNMVDAIKNNTINMPPLP